MYRTLSIGLATHSIFCITLQILFVTHESPQGYAVKKTKMYRLKYKMVFSLDRLKGLIQICVSMRVTSLNCTEHSLSLY